MISKKRKSELLIIVLFIIITILFGLKCLLSTEISFYDEMSYLAIALRFYKGDAMLVDDWAPMQLNGFLLMPLVGLYYRIWGSMEGIVIFFRMIYLLMKILVSVFAILRFRKEGKNNIYYILGIAFYYFATPYNIDTLSYNTIPISMLFLIMTIIMTHRKDNNIDWLLCGVFLAIAILGHPFIFLVYLIGSFAMLLYVIRAKIKKLSVDKEYQRMWLYITCGSIIVALIFAIFIFSRASISEIVKNLPYIFNEPDHDNGLFEKLWYFFKDILWDYLFITIINCICIVFKKDNWHRFFSFGCLAVSCIYLLCLKNPFIENLIYIPFIWFTIEQILYYTNRRKNIFIYVMLMLSALGVSLGTNTRILSTSAAMCNLASLACFVIGESYTKIEKLEKKEKLLELVVPCILMVTFVMRLFIVWRSWFRLEDFQYYIDRGPLKYTYTSEEIWKDYYTVLDDLNSIDCKEGDIFFCGTYTPLTYLYLDLEYGTMGVAFFFLDYERINTYWEMHPEKKADVIYYLELSNTDEENVFIEKLYDDYEVQLIGERLIATKR